nr:calcium-binding protein [Massilia mucilaginosa]
MTGTAGNDNLSDGSGDDLLSGLDGDDTLSTYSGNDSLDGGAGNDVIYASSGFSDAPRKLTLLGGAGDDTIITAPQAAGSRVDIWGGSGTDDFVFLRNQHRQTTVIRDFQPGVGGDQLQYDALFPLSPNPFGSAGYLRLVQSGNNTLFQIDEDGAAGTAAGFLTLATLANVQVSSLHAANFGTGNRPDGTEGGRYFLGTTGDDNLSGGSGGDTLVGGVGVDHLDGGADDDALYGGEGDDHLYGQDGNDLVEAGDGADLLEGHAGNDTLNGGAGNDTMEGGNGDDLLTGGDGNDLLMSGQGVDTLFGGNGDDELVLFQGLGVLDGGAGNDSLDGGWGGVQLNGGSGNDYLKVGGKGDSGLFGGSGSDVFDIKLNNEGRVVVGGGAGDDTVIVHPDYFSIGSVTAIGGLGVDTYKMDNFPRQSSFSIKDFSVGAGGDRLDVSHAVLPWINPGNPLLTGTVRLVQSGTSTLVQLDLDGEGGSNYVETFFTLQNVDARTLTIDNFLYTPAASGSAMAPVELVGVPAGAQLIG